MAATTLERLLRLGPRLDELLELDAPARQAHLARLRASDAALADDLAALLARQTAIDREAFLEGGALDLSGATLAGLASAGGLYVPREWPSFSTDEIAAMAGLRHARETGEGLFKQLPFRIALLWLTVGAV